MAAAEGICLDWVDFPAGSPTMHHEGSQPQHEAAER
jgi:hypothetical protein